MRKRLEKSAILTGQTETISIMDFRKSPGDVFLQAQMGKVFNITKNGVVVAVLHAPEPNALELGAEIRRLKLATHFDIHWPIATGSVRHHRVFAATSK